MNRYFKFLKQYKKNIIIGPICKWLEAVFELIVPLIMASIIDVGVKNKDISYVLICGAILLVLATLGLIFAIICQKNASIAAQGFGTNVRNALFSHINSLSHRELDKIGEQKIKTTLTLDINQMQHAVAMTIRLVVRSPFLVIGAIFMSFLIDVKVALIIVAASMLVGVVLYLNMSKSVKYLKLNQEYLEDLSIITKENLEGNRVVKAFGKQDYENKRFQCKAEKLYDNSLKYSKIASLLNPLTLIIINFGIVFILWVSGYRVNSGNLTQGEIVAFVNYMAQILSAIVMIANVIVVFTKANVSTRRVSSVFDVENSVCENEDVGNNNDYNSDDYNNDDYNSDDCNNDIILNKDFSEITENNNIVKFEDVSFSYTNNEKYSLQNINFSLKKGESLGIIGGTGSGKSTLINLLLRFYDTTIGDIYFYNNNIKDINLKELRSKIGVAYQKAALFSGTIEDNLKWGKEDATYDEMVEALKISKSYDFVFEKADNLKTKVSEGGKNFSGGQRQRLTIARAVISKPDILVLDDSFSALDFATELQLRQNIKALNLTTIYISQRANSLKHCSKIIVLNNGKIDGIGNHNYLYKNCALYKEIFDSQEKGI